MPSGAAYLVAGLVGMIVIIIVVMVLVMAFIWTERRGISRFQIRIGPNRVGPFGLLQPIADAIKVLAKEDITPAKGDRRVHWLAPVIAFLPALLVFAVVPFQERAVLADLNIAILYIVAISSISVIGIFMAGWSSNNKYSLISAMRAVAQMVSYEVPLVLSLIGVVLMAGSLSLVTIVHEQHIPFILLQPLGFFIYFLGASAELNRSPFDLLEAESEIVAGYHIEYSGMKFALFFLAEYAYAVGVSALITILFLGGWKMPWVGVIPPFLWFIVKMFLVFLFIVWVRSTLPRFRVDQLTAFAWKFLFPLSLVNMFVTAAEVLIWGGKFPWLLVPVNFVLAAAFIFLWSRFFRVGGRRVEA